MYRNLVLFLSLVIVSCLLHSCSVGMAMSGKRTPDLGVIKQGTNRSEVEVQLGYPVKTSTLDAGGVVNIYEYEIGNDPSAGRASAHAIMDALTLGIWEIVGTPIEAFQGEKKYIQIEYDKSDRVVKVKASNNKTSF